MIRALAAVASSFVFDGLRRIPLSMLCSTFALSTFAQLGVEGTNQLYFAASANGASVGFDALILREARRVRDHAAACRHPRHVLPCS